MRRLVLVAAAIGCAFVGGYLGGAASVSSAPAPSTSEPSRPHVSGSPRGLAEADVRRVLREELAAMPRAPQDVAGGDAAARTVAEPSASAVAAFGAGEQRVRNAIAVGQWTRNDAQTFGQELVAMTPDQRDEVLQTLVPALNRGEVRLSYRGPLF